MKVFLTGGSGFIGRNLIEYFQGRHTVLAPTHNELDLLDELAVTAFMKQNPVDILIHSAVKPGHRNAKDFSGILTSNTQMFFNLIKNEDSFGKMIYLGTGLCYDLRAYVPKMTEEYFGQHIPADEAGHAKYVCANECLKNSKTTDLRIFGVFGKYEDYAIRFISNAICKSLLNMPITLRQNRNFDYIFIDDLTRIIEFFMQNEVEYRSYNITPDKSVSLLEIAHLVCEITGNQNLPIVSQEGMGTEYSGDNSRLRNLIPAYEFTPLRNAITDLTDYYKTVIHTFDKAIFAHDK